MVRIGLAVQPVINLMRDALLESGLIHGDETTFQVLKEPGRRAQTKSYVWAQASVDPPIRLFAYTPGRGTAHARSLYAGIRSATVLMSDGYEVYNGIAREHGQVHLGWWAHTRRGFVKAETRAARGAHTGGAGHALHRPDRPAVRRQGAQRHMGVRSTAAITTAL
jgi:transposase